MDKKQALQIVEQALEIASKAGAFGLATAAQIHMAILSLKQEDKPEQKEESPKEKPKK